MTGVSIKKRLIINLSSVAGLVGVPPMRPAACYNSPMQKTESIKDPKIQRKYAGQYIARRKDAVVVHDKNGGKVFEKIDQKGINPTTVVIDYVDPPDPFFSLHVG